MCSDSVSIDDRRSSVFFRLLLSIALLLTPLLTTSGLMAGVGDTAKIEIPCHGVGVDQEETASNKCCEGGACFCDLGTSPGAASHKSVIDFIFPDTQLTVSLPAPHLLAGFTHLPDRPPNDFFI